jgi:hypothetical protein
MKSSNLDRTGLSQLLQSLISSGRKGLEKVKFVDMVATTPYKVFNALPIRTLQDRKTTHIKRL